MNQEIKAMWVAALLSGEYKQGKGQLRPTADTFCCLGVLCNLHAQAHPEVAAQQVSRSSYMGEVSTLPAGVMRWAGLPSDRGVIVMVSDHNDRGKTFLQIAAAIEAQL